MKKTIFQVAVLQHKELDDYKVETVMVVPPQHILAASAENARVVVSRMIPDNLVDDLDNMEIIVRNFNRQDDSVRPGSNNSCYMRDFTPIVVATPINTSGSFNHNVTQLNYSIQNGMGASEALELALADSTGAVVAYTSGGEADLGIPDLGNISSGGVTCTSGGGLTGRFTTLQAFAAITNKNNLAQF